MTAAFVRMLFLEKERCDEGDCDDVLRDAADGPGCGQFLQGDAPSQPAVAGDASSLTPATEDAGDSSNDATSSSAADADADAGSEDATSPATTCPAGTALMTETSVASSTAFLGESGQQFANFPICNMGAGNCLMRFSPSADVLDAFAKERVIDVTLSVHRASDSSQCGGSCNSLRDDGTLSINAVRSDWDPNAVTFTKRDSSNNWQSPGPGGSADISNQVGTSSAAAADDVASATIIPNAFASFLTVSSTTISLRSTFMKGSDRRQFVVVLIPRIDTQPNEPPKVAIRYCH